jgi:hypothetical protein
MVMRPGGTLRTQNTGHVDRHQPVPSLSVSVASGPGRRLFTRTPAAPRFYTTLSAAAATSFGSAFRHKAAAPIRHCGLLAAPRLLTIQQRQLRLSRRERRADCPP